MKKKYTIISFIIICGFYFCQGLCLVYAQETARAPKSLDDYEKEIIVYKPDPNYPDDIYIVAGIREAIAAKREGNGGIGVCLVDEKTGKIIETGHNRQYKPYFRSDLHAEMDILTRYETRIKMQNSINGKYTNPRTMYQGLIIYSTLEPCMMCLARIINAGLPRVYYAVSDDSMGMANSIQNMPSYWRGILEKQMKYEAARCSPRLKEIAADIALMKK